MKEGRSAWIYIFIACACLALPSSSRSRRAAGRRCGCPCPGRSAAREPGKSQVPPGESSATSQRIQRTCLQGAAPDREESELRNRHQSLTRVCEGARRQKGSALHALPSATEKSDRSAFLHLLDMFPLRILLIKPPQRCNHLEFVFRISYYSKW